MKNNSEIYKIKLHNIKKYFKKEKLFLELYLENYENYYIYIRIDYFKKIKSYRLSWFDLDNITNNIKQSISFEQIPNQIIDYYKELFSKINIKNTNLFNKQKLTGKVTIYANTKTHNSDTFNLTFYKYIPKNLSILSPIIISIFNNLPKKLEAFLFELHAELTNTTRSYEYKEPFTFDLFKDNIDSIFTPQIVLKGKKYFSTNKILFLEEINNKYFSVVNGTHKYVVIIKYDDEEKIIQLYCSCPCEFYCKHIYAVLLGIRNKAFKRFYKISYNNPNINLLENIINFNYTLCLGVKNKDFEIIDGNGQIRLIPILDNNGENHWEILEDDENETLTKYVNELINN